MKALILSADGFEDLELFYPLYRLEEDGLEVDVASPQGQPIAGHHGYVAPSNLEYGEISPADYELLVIPGGAASEQVRLREEAIDIARTFHSAGKLIASIGRGAQVLISAGVLSGRSLTCSPAIRDDVRAAGAAYRDVPVVVDETLITSRGPNDMAAFMGRITEALRASANS